VTLLVALIGTNGIVVAADSRATFGDARQTTAQNDTMQKAHILSPHVAALMAGTGEIGEMVIQETRKHLQDVDGVVPVMEVVRNTVIECYDAWFPTLPAVPVLAAVQMGQAAMRPELGLIVAGYDEHSDAHLYSLVSILGFPPMRHAQGFAVQGVAQYALYLLNRLYEPNRTVEELEALAVYVITETAGQDGKVGGPVNVITISPGVEGCQTLSADVVVEIHARNESRLKALRDSFYDRTT
jgi:20S proteasome alpha/beta subunit